jgi:hypothetical protein
MADKSHQTSKINHLLVVGLVLYAVAWFVPVYKGQDLVGTLGHFSKSLQGFAQGANNTPAASQMPSGPDWLPGWQACLFSWNILIDETTWSENASWKAQVAGTSCLTNFAMLVSLLLVLGRRQNVVMGLVMLACAGLDASWLWLIDKDPFSVFRVGYFLWVASFAAVGLGMLAPATGGKRAGK